MSGELAQMVERPLSMPEVPGSMPGYSNNTFLFILSFSRAISQICFFSFISVIFAVVFPHFCSIFGENPTVKSLVHCPYFFSKKHSTAALLFTEQICKVVPRYVTDVITLPK